jgi:hypothetical protein
MSDLNWDDHTHADGVTIRRQGEGFALVHPNGQTIKLCPCCGGKMLGQTAAKTVGGSAWLIGGKLELTAMQGVPPADPQRLFPSNLACGVQ